MRPAFSEARSSAGGKVEACRSSSRASGLLGDRLKKEFVLALVGVVAVETSLFWRGGMGLNGSEIFFFMTVETELRAFFGEEAFFIGLMRAVAGNTLTISGWIMFEGRLRNRLLEILVTLIAQLRIGLDKQLFVR